MTLPMNTTANIAARNEICILTKWVSQGRSCIYAKTHLRTHFDLKIVEDYITVLMDSWCYVYTTCTWTINNISKSNMWICDDGITSSRAPFGDLSPNEGLVTKSVLILANSTDPDETPRLAASHLGLRCLYMFLFCMQSAWRQVLTLYLRLATLLLLK